MKRSVDRALRLEYFVRPFRRRHVVGGDLFQREHHVDPAEHQHALLDLHFAARHRRQPISTCRDLARLQRAPQGTEESTTCRSHDVVDGRGVRIRHLSLNTVMASDGSMGPEPYGLGFCRHVREAERATNPGQGNQRGIDDLTHETDVAQDFRPRQTEHSMQ